MPYAKPQDEQDLSKNPIDVDPPEDATVNNLRLFKEAGIAIATLLGGHIPEPLREDLYRRAHHRQHIRAVNRLVEFVRQIQAYLVPVARGELDVVPPRQGNLLAAPLRELHGQLLNLHCDLAGLATGDTNQRFAGMGEISENLNRVVTMLREKDRAIARLEQQLLESGLADIVQDESPVAV